MKNNSETTTKSDENSFIYAITIILFIIVIINIYYYAVLHISNKILWTPRDFEPYIHFNYNDLKISKFFIKENIKTGDNHIIFGGLYNSIRIPSYSDIIFLGNNACSSCIGEILDHNSINMFSKFGSIFIYDYRGHGKSLGISNEHNAFNDSYEVYNYLITIKKIKPSNIIIFGYSLGSSVASNLVKQIIEKNNKLPSGLILINGFTSIKDLAYELNPYIGPLMISGLTTDKFLEYIDEKTTNFNILIIHSVEDELINHKHSIKLKNIIKNNNVQFLEASGSHRECRFGLIHEKFIKNIINTINK